MLLETCSLDPRSDPSRSLVEDYTDMVAIPVLLIAFNRPKLIEMQVERLQSIEISKLYVAVDGPRYGNTDDRIYCAEVQRVIDKAEFPFPVQTSFQKNNRGCGRGVSQAITWFFENEELGVILEDDCLADPSFFSFAETLLTRYADDERVFMISGNNFNPESSIPLNSYGFSQYPHIWGWASWRRAWRHYDFDLQAWPSSKEAGLLKSKFAHSPKMQKYWEKKFDAAYRKLIDTWDYQWVLTMWERDGLVIIPPSNLVTNLGFGSDATHPAPEPLWWAGRLVAPLLLPLVDPDSPNINESHEAFEDRVIFQTSRSFRKRVANKISLTRSRRLSE